MAETIKHKFYPDEEAEKREIIRQYRALMRALKSKLKKGDKAQVRHAFEMAAEAHLDMRRKSGEPYILHPLAVAQITVQEIGLGVTSAICALLHDTVEDTEVTLEDISRDFDSQCVRIIDGLTKISTVLEETNTSTKQAENFKKILLTLAEDPRVILIKLADRLHNMRTLDSMKREKQLKIASETVFIYAPLAHRLGLYNIKTEMEDLALKYTEPETYFTIARKLKESKRQRNRYIQEFIKPIKKRLAEEGFDLQIYGRPKSIHSIWNKMKKKGVSFEEVYDLFAIRIILNSPPEREKADCWRVYSIITDYYIPSPERMRDWLSNPKSNGYEALHTTVMGPVGKWVEVQIRSTRMNEIAEMGLAAHWKYKEGYSQDTKFDQWFHQIREALDSPGASTLDFVEDFKLNLFSEEIYVYTPKGDLKVLPAGATALDFAFSIHTDIGSTCIGAKVNHRLVPISHILHSADQVEIITSSKQKPSEDWLNFVVTAKAKSKIKDALKEEKRTVAAEGKAQLDRKLKRLGAADNTANTNELMQFFKQPSALDLWYGIARRTVDLKRLSAFTIKGGKLEAPVAPKPAAAQTKKPVQSPKAAPKETELIIFGEDSNNIQYKLAQCCKPIPGDDVFGFVTASEGLKIHRTNCPNAAQLLSHYGHRVVKTKWAKNKEISFLTGLRMIGLDDVGIIHDITNVVSGELKINIAALTIESKEGIFEGVIKVYIHDKSELDELANRLEQIKGIQSVTRLEPEE